MIMCLSQGEIAFEGGEGGTGREGTGHAWGRAPSRLCLQTKPALLIKSSDQSGPPKINDTATEQTRKGVDFFFL